MTTDIASYVTELKEISSEVKIRTLELNKLKGRKKTIEEKILKFLEEKDQPGVKYKGVAVIAEEKAKRKPKKKSQKIEDCISVLRGHNINNPERILKDIFETIKGDEVETKSIRIKDVK
jgi:hypothetical protein